MRTPVTNASRLASVALTCNPILRQVTAIWYKVSDDDQFQTVSFEHGEPPESGAEHDALVVLRRIYNSDDGLLNPDGDAVAVDMRSLAIDFGFLTPADISDEFGGNPFAIPAVGQGVITIGTRLFSAQLFRAMNGTPTNPPADWYDGTRANGLAVDLGGWHTTRSAAISAGSTGATVWYAEDRVGVPSDGGDPTYNGWSITAEFDVEFSETDTLDETAWHAVQTDDDMYRGYRLPNGSRRVVRIVDAVDLEWAELYRDTPYNVNGHSVHYPFGGTLNLNLYQRLRFRKRPFGYWGAGSSHGNPGAEMVAIVPRPDGGWQSGEISASDELGTLSWVYDDVAGLSVGFHGPGSFERITLPTGVRRSGTDSAGRGLPAKKMAGKAKFVGADSASPHLATGFVVYDFAGETSYERFQLVIEGSTV